MKRTHLMRNVRNFLFRRKGDCIVMFIGLFLPFAVAAQATWSLKIEKGSLENAIDKIRTATGAIIAYNKTDLAALQTGAATYSNLSTEDILKKLLRGLPVRIQKNGSTFLLLKVQQEIKDTLVKKLPGRIAGKVIDEDNGQPVSSATVEIAGKSTVTEIDGSFSMFLPKGQYSATISFVGYTTKKLTDIELKDNELLELNVSLRRGKDQLSSVVVTASAKKESISALYTRQRNSAAISDGISAEQFKATPDNNAAQVLKRISGLTVQDDKYVTVRGLSDRYNNVQINGANLPSSEPNRRNFAFDILPANLIDQIIVHKTATPDMPAEFAGGLVLVNTRDIPDENYLAITAGSGINTNTTGNPFYQTARGDKDHIGFDDGRRTWWRKGFNGNQYRQDEWNKNQAGLKAAASSIPNNFGLYEYNYSPVQNYQVSAGRKMLLPSTAVLGVSLALTYRNEQNTGNEERYIPSGYHFDSSSRSYNYTTNIGGLLNIGFQKAGTKLAFKSLYNRRFNNETVVFNGQEHSFQIANGINRVMYYTSVTVINDLLQNRLEGEHILPGKIKFNWSGDLIMINRDQPDTRASQGYEVNGPKDYYQYLLSDMTGYMVRGLSIFNSRLEEKRQNVNAQFSIPLSFGSVKPLIKVGYAANFRQADFRSMGLRLFRNDNASGQSADSAIFGKADYELHDLIGPGFITIRTSAPGAGFSADNYSGKQDLHAGFAMADISFLQRFRAIGGIRVEKNTMNVNAVSFDQSGLPVDSLIKYRSTDWLPSFNLVYKLARNMNLRFAYSKTLSRSDFRERAPFVYFEFKERGVYRGSTALRDASVKNIDFRFEYYPGPREVISLSAFHKQFESPVEIVSALGSPEMINFFFNLKSSTSRGLELELRKSLGFFAPRSNWLKDLFFYANGSLMDAVVKYNVDALLAAADAGTGGTGEMSDSRNRPLQGLSPYTMNGGVGYFGKKYGFNITYNRYGKRIIAGGVMPYQDQYENPRDVIDLQLSASFLKNKLQFKFNLSDLLQQDYIVYQNVKATSPHVSGGGAFELGDENRLLENANHDPKGTSYNKELDYVPHRWFKGRNLSFNLTYNF